MFSNASILYEQASSGNYQFNASGFRREGSVLNRSGQNFMFTNFSSQPSNSGFNLSDKKEPFQYIVKPSSVSSIFNGVRYKYYTTVPSLGSGIYTYPTTPVPPSFPATSGEGGNNSNNNGSGLL
ncbi:MAG: hypothetical protein EBU90_14490 [Proteobacteria bacterium]|nr:hypothetical protein [Pseudomonadota bacterium]NBP16573.1 hypothetical protein [bacterium]